MLTSTENKRTVYIIYLGGSEMKYRINYDGKYEDSLIIEEDTIEEIRETTLHEVKIRGWDEEDCWSERLSD